VSLVLQEVVVALAVVACALYSAWRLMSGSARLRTLTGLARVPGVAGSRWHTRLTRQTLARGGCGGCAAATPGAAAPNQTPGAPRR